MNQSNGTALAVPALSDKQIRTRLETAKGAGYGLEEATRDQLNVIYLLCQRYRLDPLTHVTLYRGRPWVTIDGRVELAKRNPDYKDFRTRPLNHEEKKAWDYRPEDLVVECTIRTYSGAEYVSRGKVTADERKKNSPTGSNPQEMAEKRALARTLRLAFGQSAFMDEDDAEQEDAQRNDPQEQARLAQRHREIFDVEEDEPPTVSKKTQPNQGASAPVGAPAPEQEQAAAIVDKAHAAARQRELDLAEIDRQRKEEGLIS
jgi:hypothetical protein